MEPSEIKQMICRLGCGRRSARQPAHIVDYWCTFQHPTARERSVHRPSPLFSLSVPQVRIGPSQTHNPDLVGRSLFSSFSR
jgi:hypothetical protein